jgi:hypothetical protein
MRTVFNNRQCAHVWVQQTQSHGHSGSISFEGDTLSSYGTPVARIVKSRAGRVLLLTSRNYSVTTSAHCSHAWQAFKGESFRVPSLGVFGGRHHESSANDKPNHRENLAHLVAVYRAECLRLRRARTLYQSIASSLEYSARMATSYAVAFGFKSRLDVAADVAAIEEFRAARDARLNTPAAIAKRAKVAAHREAVEEDRRRRNVLLSAACVAEWRIGGAVYLNWDAQRTAEGSAMLRVKPGDPDTLQTSQGAEVPLAHARIAFDAVATVRRLGIAYRRGDSDAPIRVGHFTVDRISETGDVHAGCHFLSWSEIDRFTTAQGWRTSEAA